MHVRLPKTATRHCEWGPPALERYGEWADVIVIVDVLSFSTAVSVATDAGGVVHPFPWKGERAEAFAAERGATLARKRGTGEFSLSPGSLAGIAPGTRVVLPSPNGSTLSALAAGSSRPGTPVLAGCLRNATAVARAAEDLGERVLVVAAGERWVGGADDSNGTLRPALEDWLGAGAILEALSSTVTGFTPEADSARNAFMDAHPRLARVIGSCGSGLELRDAGFPEDVRLASEFDASRGAPRMVDGAYRSNR